MIAFQIESERVSSPKQKREIIIKVKRGDQDDESLVRSRK